MDSSQLPEPRELVFAVCHEIGNLMTAVQLEADLLDEAESPVGLAASAVKIEDLCAQVGGLLSQVRPLLSDEPVSIQTAVEPEIIVASVGAQLEWRGSGHVEITTEVSPGLPKLDVDPDSVRDLLLAVVSAVLDSRCGCKHLSVAAVASAGGVAFRVVDDGAAEEALEDWRRAARCGRPLVCSIGESLLRRIGGRVEVRREAEQTVIEFWLPSGTS